MIVRLPFRTGTLPLKIVAHLLNTGAHLLVIVTLPFRIVAHPLMIATLLFKIATVPLQSLTHPLKTVRLPFRMAIDLFRTGTVLLKIDAHPLKILAVPFRMATNCWCFCFPLMILYLFEADGLKNAGPEAWAKRYPCFVLLLLGFTGIVYCLALTYNVLPTGVSFLLVQVIHLSFNTQKITPVGCYQQYVTQRRSVVRLLSNLQNLSASLLKTLLNLKLSNKFSRTRTL
jgi:hypothetical protein